MIIIRHPFLFLSTADMMENKEEKKSTLRVSDGVSQPPSVNPYVLTKSGIKRRKRYSVDEYVGAIISGNRTILSQAITLVESALPEQHREPILAGLLQYDFRLWADLVSVWTGC